MTTTSEEVQWPKNCDDNIDEDTIPNRSFYDKSSLKNKVFL